MSMDRMNKLALLDSEIFQELEAAEIRKQAQTLSDKIVNSPVTQKAITDGITRALENKADDGEELELEQFRKDISKLTQKELLAFFNMLADGLEAQGIDPAEALSTNAPKLKEVSLEEGMDVPPAVDDIDEMDYEDDDYPEVTAHIISELTKIAHNAADNQNTEAAYLIERTIQRLL